MAYVNDRNSLRIIDFQRLRNNGHGLGAYVNDRNSLRVIDFQRVRVGNRGMGDLPYVAPEMPAEVTHPYAVMSVCDVQRHLVAAGKLPRSSVDGKWGPESHSALNKFATTLPLGVTRSVMATGTSGVPDFGGREDYRKDGGKVRIPQAYAMAFPPKADVACGASDAAEKSDAEPALLSAINRVKSNIPWVIGIGAAAFVAFLAFREKKVNKS